MIYHIANLEDYSNSKVRGTYFPAAFHQDGFIHCSTSEQVIPVANRWFLNSTNLVLLEIDEDKLENDVVYENLEGGLELYPHVYGEIPYPAVFRFAFLRPGTGGFSFPSEWISVDH